MPRRTTALPIIRSSDSRAVASLVDRRPARNPAIERTAAAIVDRVRRQGDRAVMTYAKRFDTLREPMEVTRAEMRDARQQVPADVRRAIQQAAAHVRHVAARQVPRAWAVTPAAGVRITQRVQPLDRVGCYVPGGRYPLPSSLLMTAIPAVVAGVPEVVAVCPRPDATVLFAAAEAGVSRLFRIGGAHAVAALAYGTATIPRVDKIVGPGNAYVAAAKALVATDCAIDFFAGPTEIAIVSTRGTPAWIAADLIAQAEHDPDARAILFTPSPTLALAVAADVQRQLPATGPAAAALRNNGAVVVTRSEAEAIALSNRMAPEHVVCDTQAVAARLTRAGTIFVGNHSAQACGDYMTGSNHVLPTSGAAAARGGLSAADFVRVVNVQQITARGLQRIGPDAVSLAAAEGLVGHAASIRIRLEPTKRGHGKSAPLTAKGRSRRERRKNTPLTAKDRSRRERRKNAPLTAKGRSRGERRKNAPVTAKGRSRREHRKNAPLTAKGRSRGERRKIAPLTAKGRSRGERRKNAPRLQKAARENKQ
jgi:histidinol dehydrogenase